MDGEASENLLVDQLEGSGGGESKLFGEFSEISWVNPLA